MSYSIIYLIVTVIFPSGKSTCSFSCLLLPSLASSPLNPCPRHLFDASGSRVFPAKFQSRFRTLLALLPRLTLWFVLPRTEWETRLERSAESREGAIARLTGTLPFPHSFATGGREGANSWEIIGRATGERQTGVPICDEDSPRSRRRHRARRQTSRCRGID